MEELKLPSEAIDSDWKDDIDYEPYVDEETYIRPEEVEKTTAEAAKRRNIKIGRIALFKKDEVLA